MNINTSGNGRRLSKMRKRKALPGSYMFFTVGAAQNESGNELTDLLPRPPARVDNEDAESTYIDIEDFSSTPGDDPRFKELREIVAEQEKTLQNNFREQSRLYRTEGLPIDLTSIGIDKSKITCLIQCLNQCDQFREDVKLNVILEGNTLTLETIQCFLAGIKMLYNSDVLISAINLTQTDLDGESMRELADFFKAGAHQVTELILENNDAIVKTRVGIESLCEIIELNQGLTCLSLNAVRMNENGQGRELIIRLAAALAKNKTICKLFLEATNLKPEDLVTIFTAIQEQEEPWPVKHLSLSHTIIPEHMFHVLFPLFRNDVFKPLESLDLAYLNFATDQRHTEHDATEPTKSLSKFLSEIMKQNSSLETLILRCNRLDDVDCQHLKQLLETNCGLKHLDLSDNRITGVGAKLLLEGLQAARGSKVCVLDLAGNDFMCQGTMSPLEEQEIARELKKIQLGNLPHSKMLLKLTKDQH